MKEEAVLLGPTQSLVGIVTDPPEGEGREHLPAMILLNAGLVHRVGPNRLYVKIARHLASMGFVVLRFDFSGQGDSDIRRDNLPFAKIAVDETEHAMHWLRTTRGRERFVLIGLCSGAAVALRAARDDARVVGAVLINPQGADDALNSYSSNRNAARYYWQDAFFNPQRWQRVLRGKTDYWNIFKVLTFQLQSLLARAPNVSSEGKKIVADLCILVERHVRLLLVFSTGDTGLEYFRLLLGNPTHALNADRTLQVEVIDKADHIFTPLRCQDQLLAVMHTWAETTMQEGDVFTP